jgi:hypothetical protein
MAAPDVNAKQVYVSAIGGTQVGVDDAHSVAKPWTIAFWYPKVLKTLQFVSGQTSIPASAKNVYKVITRKGVTVHASLPAQVMLVSTEISIPAGADLVDAANIRAALSSHIGALSQQSAGVGDTGVTGAA